MSNIFGVHEQMDFLVYRNRHLGGHDVVPGIGIVLGIETKEVLRALINELRVKGAERSIRTGVAKIESELARLDLYRHSAGRWRVEVDIRPRFDAEYSEGQNLNAYNQEGSDHQTGGAARKVLDLRVRATIGELPDEKSQEQLCGEKGDSSLRHGF